MSPSCVQEVVVEGGDTKLIISDEAFREQQLICEKLATASHATLLEVDLKDTFGYRSNFPPACQYL